MCDVLCVVRFERQFIVVMRNKSKCKHSDSGINKLCSKARHSQPQLLPHTQRHNQRQRLHLCLSLCSHNRYSRNQCSHSQCSHNLCSHNLCSLLLHRWEFLYLVTLPRNLTSRR